ncbi:P4Hc [Seminavis robusta]|uniref:P4Hc n=1 Tax=Seminavis robusta TaxID=568900 RepID=A0A9N8DQQ9_9STRA|nr:P4Hc [Seminavis robusta]|eukprot:Sro271_g104680.1 P4Hc (375) ;mRNA; r:69359-70483
MKFTIPSAASFLWLSLLVGLTTRYRDGLAAAASASNPQLDLLTPDVKALVSQIAALRATNEEQHADLWRRLGKTQLDAREYGEARRIFCRGSELCPSDEKLRHHVKVYDTFQGEAEFLEETSSTGNSVVPQPLEIKPTVAGKPDLILSLDVPREAIPLAIKRWKGKIPPEDRCRLIHASTEPILSRDACQYLIQSALETVKHRGWTKDRHVQAPTCDIPVFDLPVAAKQWCRHAMKQSLLPLLATTVAPELDIDPNDLHIQDCFIVRYDGGGEESGPGFDSLRPHEDESLLSLTIALNDQSEYNGGGLYIHSTGDLLNGDAGTVLCFAGQLVHGGYPVVQGTRWILTVFLYVDANESGKPVGYTLDALQALQQK